ncbi:hypothetical protein A7975_00770 [Bacillus sp. FJAT-26390]|nr:hypothetical protein A7975_00770 [Bacillus sp. FJAT-26390]
MSVLPYDLEHENSVMKLSHKAWLLFKYNKDYGHQKMSCVLDEDGGLIALAYSCIPFRLMKAMSW